MPALRLAARLTPVVVGIAALTVACGSSKASSTGTVTPPAATTTAAAAPTTATSMPGMPSMTASTARAATTTAPATHAATHAAATTAAAAAVTVTIQNFEFGAPSGAVRPGATVTVINMDGVEHTYQDVKGSFNTGPIPANGGKVTFTAPAAGTYQIKCSFHPSMHGTLTVS